MPAKVEGWPPRWLTQVPAADCERGDGADVALFLEGYCRQVKDSVAGRSGELLELRPWQRALLDALFARRPDGRLRHRTALVGMPRKNGKSALLSGIGLYGLFVGPNGAEVYCCAGDRDQARIVFGVAKRMIELDAELTAKTKLYRDAVEFPETGSVLRVLSAEAYTKEGLSPTLVCFDEVHVQPSDELWNVMQLGAAARVDPLMVGITTAGSRTDSLGRDSMCYRMYQYGCRVASGEVDDPSFFFAWWEPKSGTGADHTDPDVWAEANPGYGDLVDAEDFEAMVKRTPEAEFRTKRTNVWVVSNESALPHGAWDACVAEPRRDDPVLFVDGSWNGDCTGIVGCTASGHVFVVDVWERPLDDPHWRVPLTDVKARLLQATRDLHPRWVAFDPYRMGQMMQECAAEGVPVMEFPNTVPRMVPAWKRFYDDVLDRTLSHDDDPRLARHVENMRLKVDQQGARPVKESKSSGRHIDLGICAVGAWAIHDLDAVAPSLTFAAWG